MAGDNARNDTTNPSRVAGEQEGISGAAAAAAAVFDDRTRPDQQAERETERRDHRRREVVSSGTTTTERRSSNSTVEDYLSAYMRLLRDRPLLTRSVAGAITSAFGAILGCYVSSHYCYRNFNSRQQKKDALIVRRKHRNFGNSSLIDWIEVISFAFYGGLLGPAAFYW